MAASPKPPRVGTVQRRALALLLSSQDGVNADLLVHGHGVSRRVLAGLVRAELAVAKRQVAAIEVVRIRITDARRRAIKG